MRMLARFTMPYSRTLFAAALAQSLVTAVAVQSQNLLNVDFGIGTTSSKVGLAATGQTTNDFWNLYSRDDGSGGYRSWGVLADVKYADGTACPASLIVSNAAGAWSSGAADPMMGIYLYPLLRTGPITVTVSNLPAGLFQLYCYAHGQTAVENGVIRVTAGASDYGTNSTTTDAAWNTPDWQEGRQFVRFQAIQVNGSDLLQIQVEPGSSGLAVINGLQLLRTSACVSAPPGLVGWWPGEGNANDTAGANPGAAENGLAFASGTVGQAFSFDGADDDVRISAATSLDVGLGGGLTIEGWIRPTDPQAIQPLVEWNDGVSAIGVHLWLSAEYPPGVIRPLYVNLVDTQGGIHVIGTTSGFLKSNSWQHVAVTYDKASGVAALYLDGAVLQTELLGSFTPQTSYPLWFGKRAAGGGYWLGPYRGLMDEVSLYDRTLSTAEIQAIFAAGSAGKCPDVCAPSPSGLVGWWPGNGSTLDLAGTNAGVMLGETDFEAGTVASGFRFDGTNDCVLIPFSSTLDLTNFTVEAWVKPLSQVSDPDGQELIFGQAFGKPQLVVRPGTNGLKVVFMFSETIFSFPTAVSTNEIPINEFSHVAGTWDGTTLSVYLNGVLEASVAPGKTPAASTCPLYIGGFQDACGYTGQFFHGIVDEPSLYNRALAASEVQALFAAGGAGKCAPATPAITSGPASLSVNLGAAATFRVFTTGAAPLSYQWFFGTNALPGATADVLTLTNVQSEVEGDYSVVITNAFGTVTSSPARLTILLPPVITTQPRSQTVLIGSSATFSVEARGTEALSYQWRRNGISITGATAPILVIGSVQQASAGTYTVRISNAADSVISDPAVLKLASGQLTVRMTPDGPRLDVVGQAGANYAIEYSQDLNRWFTLATFLGMPTNWFHTDQTAVGVDHRFYRLRKTL